MIVASVPRSSTTTLLATPRVMHCDPIETRSEAVATRGLDHDLEVTLGRVRVVGLPVPLWFLIRPIA